jgi:hypothetical protein
MGFPIGPFTALDLVDGTRQHLLVLALLDNGKLLVSTEKGSLTYRSIDQIQVEWHYEEDRGWVDDAEALNAQATDRHQEVP